MKPKQELALSTMQTSFDEVDTAEALRNLFARINPHVPLQAYDDLLAQYRPSPIITPSEISTFSSLSTPTSPSIPMKRTKQADELVEMHPSLDIKFLMPGDTLTLGTQKDFVEQFEFSLHWVDDETQSYHTTLASDQTLLRSCLSISKVSSRNNSSTTPTTKKQITFTSPASRFDLSSFGRNLRAEAGLSTKEPLPSRRDQIITHSNSSPSIISSTPLSDNESSVITSKDGLASSVASIHDNNNGNSNSFFNPVFSLKAHSSTQKNKAPISTPVALSFRTKISPSNGNHRIDEYAYSPLFIICDSIAQVDLSICRRFRAVIPSYPIPPEPVTSSEPSSPRATTPNIQSPKFQKNSIFAAQTNSPQQTSAQKSNVNGGKLPANYSDINGSSCKGELSRLSSLQNPLTALKFW